MSENKMKYWTVQTTRIVRANNKADALAAASRKSSNGAKVLGTVPPTVDRITAVEATEVLETV